MTTFSDKAHFSLKQMIAAITIAAAAGAGIARFEFKTANIETKLDTIIASIDTNKVQNTRKFAIIEQKLLAHEIDIKSITTSLTTISAILKPDDIRLTNRRR